MPLTRQKKQKILEDLKEKIGKQKAIVFVGFSGLKVRNLFDLRERLKKADSGLIVARKTLLRLAFKNYDLDISQGIEKFREQLAVVFGFKDEILPAKIAYQFSLENKNLKILGGYFEGKFREAEETISLAKLPSREELLAKLLNSIASPISSFINVLEGNLRNLVFVLSAIKK
ncbi:50S ribosomal protein L10 [Patescibacteria group bacterium]|nr:50S ribosomal protein L10 [Patescibacteria group bacterium]